MRLKLASIVLAVLCSTLALGQAPIPQNVYAAGVAYNGSASPEIAGTALYAHLLSGGTYAFTHFDALPDTSGPSFKVQTAVGAGVAQRVFTIGKINFYVPAAAGFAWQGSNMGWQWNTGALAAIRLKGNVYAYPAVRVLKSNLDNSGVQPILEVMFGWGK